MGYTWQDAVRYFGFILGTGATYQGMLAAGFEGDWLLLIPAIVVGAVCGYIANVLVSPSESSREG